MTLLTEAQVLKIKLKNAHFHTHRTTQQHLKNKLKNKKFNVLFVKNLEEKKLLA
jgi:DNA-dependent RNA polymerase auxiliary subunit epsilon